MVEPRDELVVPLATVRVTNDLEGLGTKALAGANLADPARQKRNAIVRRIFCEAKLKGIKSFVR